jgi:hypothetical protein
VTTGSLAGIGSEPSRWLGEVLALPITERPRLDAVREALEFSALRKGDLLEELDLGIYRG